MPRTVSTKSDCPGCSCASGLNWTECIPSQSRGQTPFLERIEQPDTIPAPFQTLVGDEPVFAFDIEDEQAFPVISRVGMIAPVPLPERVGGDGDAVRFAAIGQAKWSEKFIRLPKVPRELPAVFSLP